MYEERRRRREISVGMKSREIFNFVRALSYPGPGALTSMNSIPVRIEKVELINELLFIKVYQGLYCQRMEVNSL